MRTCIFDTVTGDLKMNIEPSAATWSAKLDGSGQGSFTVPLRAQQMPQALSRDLFRGNANLVAHIDDDDTVIAAGMLLTPKYDRDAGKLSVSWVDIRDLMARRMGFNVAAWDPSGTLTVTGRSQSGAVRAILYRAMRVDSQPLWYLPIDLPDDGTGSFTRTWQYYGFASMEDCLREVEDEGAEIYFDPYLAGGQLRFQARVGAPITLGTFDLPVTAPETAVVGLQVTEDGSSQLTGVIYAGNGTDADQITAPSLHGARPITIPIRDEYRSAKDIKDVAQLQRIADADLNAHYDPIVQWSFGVRLDDDVTAAVVKPGRLLRMDVQGDEWIPDGVVTQRVIGVSGDLTQTVKVEVQGG